MGFRTRHATSVGALTTAVLAVVGVGAIAFLTNAAGGGGHVEGNQFAIRVTSPDADAQGHLNFGGRPLEPIEVADRGAITAQDLLGKADHAVRVTIEVTSPGLTGDGHAVLSEVLAEDLDNPGAAQSDDLWVMLCNQGMRTLAQCTAPVNLEDLEADEAAFDFRTRLRPGVDAFDLNVWLVAGGDAPAEPPVTQVTLGFTGFTGSNIETLPDPFPEPPFALLPEAKILHAKLGLGDGFVALVDPVDDEAGVLGLDGTEIPEIAGQAWHTTEDAVGLPIWAHVTDTIGLVLRGETGDGDALAEQVVQITGIPVTDGAFAVDLDGVELDEASADALAALLDAEAPVTIDVTRDGLASSHLLAKDQLLVELDDALDGGLLLDLADAVDGDANRCAEALVAPRCRALGEPFASLADAAAEAQATPIVLHRPDAESNDEASEPADEASEPADEASEPTDEPSEPSGEPSGEASEPAEDAATGAPSDQPSEPVPSDEPTGRDEPPPSESSGEEQPSSDDTQRARS